MFYSVSNVTIAAFLIFLGVLYLASQSIPTIHFSLLN